MSGGLSITPVLSIAEIREGDRLAEIICEHASLAPGDVVVVTQKAVSKAEGMVLQVGEGSEERRALILSQSKRVLRQRGELLITETHHGFVCANAGIDFSNVAPGHAALLPRDPDRSARRIRDGIAAITGLSVGVVVSDTFGRPWRRGVTDVAIGVAGLSAIVDLRGTTDAGGRELRATEICVADEIAAAAELVMGKAAAIPVAVVRGIDPSWLAPSSVARDVIRPVGEDLFR